MPPAPPAPASPAPAPVPAAPALVVAGAVMLGSSAVLVALSQANASTAAFHRCFLAALVLLPLALVEIRRRGRPRAAMLGLAAGGGVFLGLDFMMWAQSVLDTGAAVSTLLISTQVFVFPGLLWLLHRNRPSRQFLLALPVMLAGLVLAAGVLGADPFAVDPLRGGVLGVLAGVCYGVYLYGNHRCRAVDGRFIAVPVAVSTSAAALTVFVVGGAAGTLAVVPAAESVGWLVALAVFGQVLPWLLLSAAATGVRPEVSASLMLLQPASALLLGVVLAGEEPTLAQLAGMALVALSVWWVSGGRRLAQRRAARR